jgi:flagellar biosynthesis anti-sigma factor FlgM
MRIDLNTGIGQAADSPQTAPGARSAASSAPAESRGADTAQLSSDQARVQALTVQVNNLPEIRQQKVEALGRAVRDGSYQVSPESTADALISEMLARSAAA